MTEDFKKGLATGLAIGGVTVIKGGGDGELFTQTRFTIPNAINTPPSVFRTDNLMIEFTQVIYRKGE